MMMAEERSEEIWKKKFLEIFLYDLINAFPISSTCRYVPNDVLSNLCPFPLVIMSMLFWVSRVHKLKPRRERSGKFPSPLRNFLVYLTLVRHIKRAWKFPPTFSVNFPALIEINATGALHDPINAACKTLFCREKYLSRFCRLHTYIELYKDIRDIHEMFHFPLILSLSRILSRFSHAALTATLNFQFPHDVVRSVDSQLLKLQDVCVSHFELESKRKKSK